MKFVIEGLEKKVKYWWISLLIGAIAIIMGIWSLLAPASALNILTNVFIISFFVSGFAEVGFAIANRRHINGWGWPLAGGTIDILLGIMLLAIPTPLITVVLIYFVGFWILIRSIMAIASSIELQTLGIRGWGWLFGLAMLGLIFSLIFIFSSPVFGGTVIIAFFAIAMIMYGIFRIDLAFMLNSAKRKADLLNAVLRD